MVTLGLCMDFLAELTILTPRGIKGVVHDVITKRGSNLLEGLVSRLGGDSCQLNGLTLERVQHTSGNNRAKNKAPSSVIHRNTR